MKKTSFFAVIVSGLLWGSSCLFATTLSGYGIGTVGITAIRAIVSALFVGLFILIFQRKAFRVGWKDLVLLFFCGLGLFGSSACYFTALTKTSVATAVVLMYTAPVLVMLFSVAFLGEKMNLPKALSVGGMLLGCVLVSGVIGNMVFNGMGFLLGILSGISFAAYNVLTKILMQRGNVGTLTANFYTFLFMSILATVFCNPARTFAEVSSQAAQTVPLLILMGILTGALPYLLYAGAMKHLTAGVVSALAIIEPMASVLLGVWFMEQALTWNVVLGVAFILVSVCLLAPRDENKKKKTEKDKTI